MDPSTSTDTSEKPKRRKRTKEEIEQEKLEKDMKRIKREMSAAKNSKCEQFLFCYVDRTICLIDESLETELTNRFTERAIAGQLAFVDGDHGIGKVIWKRKRIDAVIEEGKDPEGCFVHVVDEQTFGQMTKKGELVSFIEKISKEHQHSNSLPNLIVYGQGGPRDTITTNSSLEAFEQNRSQLHRAIAKSEKRLAEDNSIVFNVEKGTKEGDLEQLKIDWWTRMLTHVHRLSEEQKRALVDKWPDPFVLMDELVSMKPNEGIKMLANLVGGNNRRIGPAAAKWIFTFLTSKDGDEFIVDG
ncbi:hypothetical protein FO519_006583 [Halicephalobus sp. NKZ332]|nr:hypothetical protein FO519_006583 [Halicephalobus sp. NKZ332]